jgi:uncharacterized iron-regulated membrane protein
MGLWVAQIHETTAQLAVGYALICVLLCIAGIIFIATGFILHSMRALLLEWLQRTPSLENREASHV